MEKKGFYKFCEAVNAIGCLIAVCVVLYLAVRSNQFITHTEETLPTLTYELCDEDRQAIGFLTVLLGENMDAMRRFHIRQEQIGMPTGSAAE